LRIDHSLLGRPLISPKRAAWLLRFDRLLGSASISFSVARGDVIERSGEAVLVDAPFGLLPLGEGYGRLPSGEFKLDLDQRTISSCVADQGLKKGAFKQQPPRLPTRAEVMTERQAGKFVPKFTPLSDARLAGNLIGRLAFAASQQFNWLRFVSSFRVRGFVIDASRLKEVGRGLGAQISSSLRSASMTASKVTGAARGLEEQTVHLKTGSLS